MPSSIQTAAGIALLVQLGYSLTTPYDVYYHTNGTAPMPFSKARPKFSNFYGESYALVTSYTSANFFDEFTFIEYDSSTDPTDGFVDYLSYSGAQSAGLVNTNNNQIYMGVDSSTVNPPNGRGSVRVSSNEAYTHGLFIADIAHMPASTCGTWPAFWTFGPDWPSNGEIDIIEGVNAMSTDTITLHTSSGCVINTSGSQSSTTSTGTNCNDGNADVGCGVDTAAPYGTPFDSADGGVYAMQWESSGVYVWAWDRSSIPSDILSGAPATEAWGTPIVAFNGGSGCDIDDHFASHNIIFNIDFCGSWAGAVWSDGSCASLASTCQDYVASNPGAFTDSYWLLNSVDVYQLAAS